MVEDVDRFDNTIRMKYSLAERVEEREREKNRPTEHDPCFLSKS